MVVSYVAVRCEFDRRAANAMVHSVASNAKHQLRRAAPSAACSVLGSPARTAQRVASLAYGSLASEAYERGESGWNTYE